MKRAGAAVLCSVTALAAWASAVPTAQSFLQPVDWQIHDTEHFEIAYAKTLEVDLDRIGRTVEGVYQQVSADLGYDLPFTPMVVLFTGGDERNRVVAAGGLLPTREHILVTLDVPDDRLAGNFAHDLTHTFQFDILPRSVQTHLPLWFTEGLAEHERGVWEPGDLAILTEAVRRQAVPRISPLAPLGVPEDLVLSRSLGHAAFDFVVSRWGKKGLRALVFSLRDRPVTLQTVYAAAFDLSPDEFDRGFEEYLTAQFH